ncbi:unnamed protein product [Paramecium sonneborni]|uniref:Uncharacterized protein n=1 Tax=Paramecium sonneborni TaxID=65129 RepID=A0A8S1QP95_9CILI|nr:unnamed protein product [Paramecium sonneborni]
MNTQSNTTSFADVQQHEYFQKFLVGQNLIDSSTSFARLNSKTVTERSIRESFLEEQNYEVILQQVMASNLRLIDQISKCQVTVIPFINRTLNPRFSSYNERIPNSPFKYSTCKTLMPNSCKTQTLVEKTNQSSKKKLKNMKETIRNSTCLNLNLNTIILWILTKYQ